MPIIGKSIELSPCVKYKVLRSTRGGIITSPFYGGYTISINENFRFDYTLGHALKAMELHDTTNEDHIYTTWGYHVFDTEEGAVAYRDEQFPLSGEVFPVIVWGKATPFIWIGNTGYAVEFITIAEIGA